MSECRTEQITCPRCHYESPMTVWNSINADLDPELKERFLDGELFDWKCEVCGLKTKVPFGTIYHDMEHRFMLFFDPWEDNRESGEAVGIAMPDGFSLPEYTFRRVYGMNALREKINTLSAGLNDIAVERMKYFLRIDRDNHLRETDDFVCAGIDNSEKAMEASGWERGAIIFIRFRDNSEPKVMPFPMELYYDYRLATDMDPRMKASGCLCIDSKWMQNQLQKQQ